MKNSKSGAAALLIPEIIHTSRIPTIYYTIAIPQFSNSGFFFRNLGFYF